MASSTKGFNRTRYAPISMRSAWKPGLAPEEFAAALAEQEREWRKVEENGIKVE
jgi:hypothetical protein